MPNDRSSRTSYTVKKENTLTVCVLKRNRLAEYTYKVRSTAKKHGLNCTKTEMTTHASFVSWIFVSK